MTLTDEIERRWRDAIDALQSRGRTAAFFRWSKYSENTLKEWKKKGAGLTKKVRFVDEVEKFLRVKGISQSASSVLLECHEWRIKPETEEEIFDCSSPYVLLDRGLRAHLHGQIDRGVSDAELEKLDQAIDEYREMLANPSAHLAPRNIFVPRLEFQNMVAGIGDYYSNVARTLINKTLINIKQLIETSIPIVGGGRAVRLYLVNASMRTSQGALLVRSKTNHKSFYCERTGSGCTELDDREATILEQSQRFSEWKRKGESELVTRKMIDRYLREVDERDVRKSPECGGRQPKVT